MSYLRAGAGAGAGWISADVWPMMGCAGSAEEEGRCPASSGDLDKEGSMKRILKFYLIVLIAAAGRITTRIGALSWQPLHINTEITVKGFACRAVLCKLSNVTYFEL